MQYLDNKDKDTDLLHIVRRNSCVIL